MQHASLLQRSAASTPHHCGVLLPPPAPCIHGVPPAIRAGHIADTVYTRRSVVAFGRRDGNSSTRREQQRRRRQRIRESEDAGILLNWWEEDGRLRKDLLDAMPEGQQGQQQPRQRRRKDEDDDDDEEDGPGWWERPEERTLQAYMPEPLKPWQAARLEQECTKGRRKMEISTLAEDLDVDRSTVLYWVKEFWKKPEFERNAILTKRNNELQEAAAKEGRREVLQAVQGTNTPAAKVKTEGFIPFYTRKEMGLTDTAKTKKLSASALRTMESVYARTPFPSRDIINGLWDLHKINYDTALQWFMARRAQDGILSSEQKRRAKDPLGRSPRDPGPLRFDDDNLLVQMGDPTPESEAQQPPQTVVVSSKQLAQLRSSLPSPKKYKGKQIAEQMGISSDGRNLKVGNVQYVERDESSASRGRQPTRKWANTWRRRRAAMPKSTLPLLAKGDSAGGAGQGEPSSQGSSEEPSS